MKKLFIAFFALLLLFVVGVLFVLPYGLGIVTQNKYTQLLDIFTKSNLAVQVTLVDYKRHWFSSEVIVKVAAKDAGAQNQQALLLKQHIEHGPIFSITSSQHVKRVVLGQALITTHMHSALGVIDCVNWLKLDGTLAGAFNAPKLHYVEGLPNQQNSAELMLSGMSGRFALSTDLKQLIAHMQVTRMLMQSSRSTQEIKNIQLAYQLQKSDSGLFLGQRAVSIDDMTWRADFIPNKTLKLQGLSIHARDGEKNRKVSSEVNAEIKYLILNNATYGPEQLILAVHQLDAPTFSMVSKELKNMHQTDLPFQQRMAKYQTLMLALFSQGLEIQIKKLQMATPWGDPSMTANFMVPAQSINTLPGLMNAMNVRAEIHLPAPFLVRVLEKINTLAQRFSLVGATMVTPTSASATTMPVATPSLSPSQRAQQQITEWVSKKWLSPKGDGYQTVLIYQNQQTTLNGYSPAKPQNNVVAGSAGRT